MAFDFKTNIILPPWLCSKSLPHNFNKNSQDQKYAFSDYYKNHSLLSSIEKTMMGILFNDFQRKILASSYSHHIIINPTDFIKNLPSSSKMLYIAFSNFLNNLGGFRLFYSHEKQRLCHYLFDEEIWNIEPSKKTVSFKLSELSEELILGVSSAFDEMMRKIFDQSTSFNFLQSESPLLISKSLWLELKGNEQEKWINLEKSTQQEKNQIQLDYLFARKIDHLNEEKITFKKNYSQHLNLQKIKIFSKKLYQHGVIKKIDQDSKYWISKDINKSPCLIWQKPESNFFESDLFAYKIMCNKFFIHRSLLHSVSSFFKIISMGLNIDLAQSLKSKIISIIKKDLDFYSKYFIESEKKEILPTVLLFIEWIFRSQKDHILPLPNELGAIFPINLIHKSCDPQNFKDNFKQLLLLNDEDTACQNLIFSHPFITICSDASQKNEIFSQYTIKIKTMFSKFSSDNFLDQNLYFHEKNAANYNTKSSLNNNPEKILRKDQIKSESKNLLKDNQQHQQLKKDIEKKLNELKKGSSKRFQILKNTYLNSLDQNSKKLILSVQEKMRPEIFDIHLQQRLIKYICENPDKLNTTL